MSIKQSYIDELLDRVNIVDVIDSRVKLKKAGKNFSACCPFHEEKTPSFTVSEEKQFYNCFGCGESGNALGFILEFDKVSFPEAVEKLRRVVGFGPIEYDQSNQASDYSQIDTRPLKSAVNDACAMYINELANSPEAIQYLKARGITRGDVGRFNIGLSPKNPFYLVNKMKAQYSYQQLEAAGLIHSKVDDSGNTKRWDFFKDRIMYPVRNLKGEFVTFGARKWQEYDINNKDVPKYINGAGTEIFKKGHTLFGLYESTLTPSPERGVFNLVEGYMDVIASHRYPDFTNTVAGMGTSITEEQIAFLFHRSEKIRMVLDGDKAGLKGAYRALLNAAPHVSATKTITFALMPAGEDPDSILKIAGGKEKLKRIYTEELSLSNFVLHYLNNLYGDTLEGQALMVADASTIVRALNDETIKALLKKTIEHHLGVELKQLENATNTSQINYIQYMQADALAALEGKSRFLLDWCGMILNEPEWKAIDINEDNLNEHEKSLLNYILKIPYQNVKSLKFDEESVKDATQAQILLAHIKSSSPTHLSEKLETLKALQSHSIDFQKKNNHSLMQTNSLQ